MNTISTSGGQTITIAGNPLGSVVNSPSGIIVNRVAGGPPATTFVGVDDDEDDDDMNDDGDDSFGEDEDDMLGGGSELTTQLAAAGPVGVAAAAAIQSTKRKRKSHAFETNLSIRKRQQTRLLRKLKSIIDEFSVRVGQQAVVLVATPGKQSVNCFRAFGAKPLEDVVKNLKSVIMSELETALSQHAPTPAVDDPNLYELPPIVVDGIPTPVEKMTQAQLRAFIPLMLKYSTGRGKPGWGKESTKPPWWPKHVPWQNVRMDARSDEEKSKQLSWTHALRDIVINCYKYHGRDDLLPKFTEEEEIKRVNITPRKVANYPFNTMTNPDGTISIVQVDPNNPVITLPDGTTAHVQLSHDGGSVHTLAELATSDTTANQPGHEIQTNEHGHILITGDDGNTIPVQVSGHQFVTIPVNSNNYQTVMANIQNGTEQTTAGQQPQQQQQQQQQHMVINAPIQISGLQHLVMKTEPGEGGGGATPSLTGQQFSVLQMADGGHQIITIRQRSPDQRESQDSNG